MAGPAEPPPSAMVDRFGRLQRYVASRLTEHVNLDRTAVDEIR